MKNLKNIPTIFVIMGITGDLTFKKIIPSLWHLYKHDHIPKNSSIIGFARRDLSGIEFKKIIEDSVITHDDHKIDKDMLSDFFSYFAYQKGDFHDDQAYYALAERIKIQESKWGMCAHKLFYLSTPPSSYESIFENLSKAQLNVPCGDDLGWSRILIEKPFGIDLESAQKLQKLLSSYFKEEQIYRIDHYLFKEIIQGIENFRFSNNLFEDTWDNTRIEKIDIRLFETIGVEKRGNFYDPIGTLRDVGQNHLLAMLAAIVGESPLGLDNFAVQQKRADVLKNIAPWTIENIKQNTKRAQYNGYQDIAGVDPRSQTETYFSLQTELTDAKWKGVTILMEAGKRMQEARKEIVVTLKHPKDCHLCKLGFHKPNQVVFRLEPNDEIVIHFYYKKPGFDDAIEERTFSFFLYEKQTKIQYVEEYSKIMYSAMVGDQSRFVSHEEVKNSWKFVDPVITSWQDDVVPLETYEPNVDFVLYKK